MVYKAVLALCLLATCAVADRDPKFLFVSSETSTVVSTTTTLASAKLTCLALSSGAAITTACAGRRKRSLIDESALELVPAISASKTSGALPDLVDTKAAEPKREGRFAWYYMTTTVTSTSVATATSTTYTSTVSISAMSCTPSQDFLAC